MDVTGGLSENDGVCFVLECLCLVWSIYYILLYRHSYQNGKKNYRVDCISFRTSLWPS